MARKIIGHVANVFGLNGALKINMETDAPETRFAKGNQVEIAGNTYKVADLRMKNAHTGQVWFENLISIDQAEKLIGSDVYADIEPLPGQVFIDDLIGCEILSESGEKLGICKDVVKMTQADYLKLENGRFVPFTVGLFVESYDLTAKKIVLTPLGAEALE